jgi:hypothetical protein
MFKLTQSAYKKLSEVIDNEKTTKEEQLYLRISMGVG